MCIAIPVRVTAILADDWAETESDGVRSRVSTAFIEAPAVGDHLIVHAGFAITRLDVIEAQKILELFAEISAHLRTHGIARNA